MILFANLFFRGSATLFVSFRFFFLHYELDLFFPRRFVFSFFFSGHAIHVYVALLYFFLVVIFFSSSFHGLISMLYCSYSRTISHSWFLRLILFIFFSLSKRSIGCIRFIFIIGRSLWRKLIPLCLNFPSQVVGSGRFGSLHQKYQFFSRSFFFFLLF